MDHPEDLRRPWVCLEQGREDVELVLPTVPQHNQRPAADPLPSLAQKGGVEGAEHRVGREPRGREVSERPMEL